jgi:WavE lipopolysaccharide synthesis
MYENFTIVIQGPWIKEMTERSIISIRENLGNTNIIMSTWQLGLLEKNFLI